MYRYVLSKKFEKLLIELYRKNKIFYLRIRKKIDEIINSYDIEHYKNLRGEMKEFKRVHVGMFVLVFRFDKSQNLIIFEDFNHHDNVYRK